MISLAAVYGKSFDSEDLSHERAFPNNKPTRKPQKNNQKKQRTSPAPSDATMMHKDHTVTTLNQVIYSIYIYNIFVTGRRIFLADCLF